MPREASARSSPILQSRIGSAQWYRRVKLQPHVPGTAHVDRPTAAVPLERDAGSAPDQAFFSLFGDLLHPASADAEHGSDLLDGAKLHLQVNPDVAVAVSEELSLQIWVQRQPAFFCFQEGRQMHRAPGFEFVLLLFQPGEVFMMVVPVAFGPAGIRRQAERHTSAAAIPVALRPIGAGLYAERRVWPLGAGLSHKGAYRAGQTAQATSPYVESGGRSIESLHALYFRMPVSTAIFMTR